MAKALAIFGTAVLMMTTNPMSAFAQDAGDEEDAVSAPVTVSVPAVEAYGVWDRLASCESSNRWHIIGRTYSGGLQFDAPTWRAYGGGAYASIAGYASREQQIAVAERLRAKRGYQPWPVCSRVLGLR